MKILHLIDSLSMGGAQSLVVEIVKVQKELGHHVEVLQVVDSKDRTFPSRLEEMGIPLNSLPYNKLYGVINIVGIIPILKKFDIVHVHLFPALYWAGFAKLLSFAKTPLVYTEHNTTNKRRNNKFLGFVDKIVYKNAYKEIIACSDKALETFKSHFPNVKSVSAINNGIDTSRYANALPYKKKELIGTDEDVFVVTMVARYAYPKRQDTVVEAISKLPSKFHAILIGSKKDSPEEIKMRNLCDKLQVSDRVHSLYIRKDIPQILKTSDAIVLSSEFEGLSLSSIEGMASAKPFLATNVNGLREVVDGAGIIFEVGDSDELARSLQNLESDSSYYNYVADQCKKRSAQYDIHTVVDKYIEVYGKYI